MSGHTPGPWFTHEVKHGDHWVGNDEADIATVEGFGPDLAAESAANARLIAAAPELLEALESLLYSARQVSVYVHGEGSDEEASDLESAIRSAAAAIALATQPLPTMSEEN